MKLDANPFSEIKVLIVGDVMIDSYIVGGIDRISPEAPVPVVNVSKREERLGGAANVALNIKALNAKPVLCSVIGNDTMGLRLKELIHKEGITDEGLVVSKFRPTTVKHRVMAGNHHVIRIDEETDQSIDGSIAKELKSKLEELIPNTDVIIVEDYDKGVLNEDIIKTIKTLARKYGKQIAVDPKRRNFDHYTDIDLFKPNFKELQEGINEKIDITNLIQVKAGVRRLYERLHCKSVMVTLSDQGIYALGRNTSFHTLAHYREISDVSGAGDTVISVAALAMAIKLPLKRIAELSNLAGGIVCEHHGVVPIDLDKLVNEFNSL